MREALGGLVEVLKEVAISLLILLSSFGLGAWLLRPFRQAREEPMFPLLATALGMGGLGYLTLFVGLLRVGWEVSAGILLLSLFLLGRGIVKGRGAFRPRSWARTFLPFLGEAPHLSLSVAMVTLVCLLLSLAPPTDWDGLSYHLAVPKRYLMEGKIHYIPDIHHSNFPSTFEMLFLLALSLGGFSAPKLLHFAAFLLCVFIASAWAEEATGKPRAGPLSAAIFCSSPVALWEAGAAYIDLALALFEAMALYSFWKWAKRGDKEWLFLSALFAGIAGGTKITGLLCGLLLLPAFFALSPKGGRLKGGLTFGAVFAATSLPWYLRSYLWTGNPVYPFAFKIFGGRNWDAFCAEMYDWSLKCYGMGRGVSALALLPWNLTFHAQNFGDGGFLILTPGPLFLALLPALLFGAKAARVGKGLLRLAILYIGARGLIWFWLSQQSRFLLPLLPLGSVAASCGAINAFRKRASRVAIEGLAVASLLSHGALFLLMSLPALTSGREDYLTKSLDIYQAQKWANRWLPREAKVLLIGETRGFYLERRYMWGDEGHHTLLRYSKMRSPKELMSRLEALGITHLMVNLRFAPTFFEGRDSMSRLFMALLEQGNLRPLSALGQVFLFEIVAEGGERWKG